MRRLELTVISLILAASPALSVRQNQASNILPAQSRRPVALLGGVSEVPEAAHFEGAPSGWIGWRYNGTGTIATAFGKPIPLMKGQSLDEAVFAFIRANSRQLGLENYREDLHQIRRTLKGTAVDLSLSADGARVIGAFITLNFNRDGQLTAIFARAFGDEIRGGFPLTEKEVRAACRTYYPGGAIRNSEMVRLPVRDGDKIILQSAWRCDLDLGRPDSAPRLFIHAETGRLLAAENLARAIDFEGTAGGSWFPLYNNREQAEGPFPYEAVLSGDVEVFTDNDGAFILQRADGEDVYPLETFLRGRWVETRVFNGAGGLLDPTTLGAEVDGGDPQAVEFIWNDETSRPDERNLYYHISFIHDWWRGFDADFHGLDLPLMAICNVGGEGFEDLEDNAFSGPDGLAFGRGRRFDNFALYADVIYHEYGHSVTAAIYGDHDLPYEEESGALNEAWSDYFTCSLTDEPLIGEILIPGGYIRNLDNNLRYPDDISHQVHADSRIVSAAMWHTREALGVGISDTLFHFARHHFPTTFRQFLIAVLLTDDDNGDLADGTPNFREIYTQFARHGINLGDGAMFAIRDLQLRDDGADDGVEGNGNGLWEPGETIGVDARVFRSGQIYPPADADVELIIYSDNPDIELITERVNLGRIGLGEVVAAPEPLLFRVTNDAALQFATVIIAVEGDRRELGDFDTLRIPLGVPPVLVVRDGAGPFDRTAYFTDALDSIDVVYAAVGFAAKPERTAEWVGLIENVIWYTGDEQDNILAPDALALLEGHLADGGRLLLTGQDAGGSEEARQFLRDYCHTEVIADSVAGVHLIGVEDDPVGRGNELLLIGGDGARNQRRPNALLAVVPAVETHHWQRVDGNPAGGVRYEDPATRARTVVLGFGLESVGGAGRTNTRAEVLAAIIEWFDSPSEIGAVFDDAPPAKFSLAAPYPNPFNATAIIRYATPSAGQVQAALTDVSGRVIAALYDGYQTAGRHSFILDGTRFAAGVYFVRMRQGMEVAERKIILIK